MRIITMKYNILPGYGIKMYFYNDDDDQLEMQSFEKKNVRFTFYVLSLEWEWE